MACTDGAGCAAGRICSTAHGKGVCLQDCTAGGACASGTACGGLMDGAKKGCLPPTTAALDGPCATEGASCGPLGAGGVCSGGRCVPPCKDGAGCSPGRACTVSAGDGVCLADCTSSGTCAGNLVCNGPWTGGKKFCVDTNAALGSTAGCTSATPGAGCGPKGLGAICDAQVCALPCKDGAGCEAGSFCSASAGDGTCLADCSAGQACGAGLSCTSLFTTDKRACLPATQGLDRDCTGPDGTACGPKGAGGTCQGSRCDVSCTGGAACPSGRACTNTAGGACMIDCTTQGCPDDLACSGPYADGKKYCTSKAGTLGASCAGTSASCGPKGTATGCDVGQCVVTCANGAGCPSGSFCSAVSGAGSCLVDCTAGQACGAGLSCNQLWNGKKACLTAGVGQDKPCATDGAACGPKGLGGVCALGLCEGSCGAACAAGRVCTKGLGQPGGACVEDCSTSGTCTDTSLVCEGLWHDGKEGCAAAGHSLQACAGVTTTSQCTFCGSDASNWTVSCSTGMCANNSACGTGNQCNCNAGYTAVDCSGVACSSSHPCTYPNWWCKPDANASATCSDPVAKVLTSCRCADGRSLSLACGSSGSCEYHCSIGCDIVKQDCPGGTDKCTLVTDATTQPVYPACVPPTGSKTDGQPCTRAYSDDDPRAPGHDDCAAGFFCSTVGQPANAKTCQRLCESDTTCETATNNAYWRCYARDSRTPTDGTCIATCSMVGAGNGLPCPAGTACASVVGNVDGQNWIPICRPVGGGALGASCSSANDCQAGFACGQSHASGSNNVCLQYCGAQTPSPSCPSGFTCKTYPNSPIGYCY
jgi:hypothetical protein